MNTVQPMTALEDLDAAPAAGAFAPGAGTPGVYLSPALQQRIDLIDHLVEFGRQIVVLSGPAGAGKTTLLDHLAEGQHAGRSLVRFDATDDLGERGLLGLLVDALEVAPDDDAEPSLEGLIRQRVAALEKAGKVVVLMIDEAEELLPESVALLMRLAHNEEQRPELKLVLAADLGRSALLETLQSANPQQGLVHVVEIPTLLESQVRELIEYRLRAAGFEPEDHFAENDYERIAALTDGLAGSVVRMARQTLIDLARLGAENRAPRASAARGPSRLFLNMGFAVLAVLAIAGGAWWANQRPLEGPTSTETVALEPPTNPPVEPAVPEASAPMEVEPAAAALPSTGDAVGEEPPSGLDASSAAATMTGSALPLAVSETPVDGGIAGAPAPTAQAIAPQVGPDEAVPSAPTEAPMAAVPPSDTSPLATPPPQPEAAPAVAAPPPASVPPAPETPVAQAAPAGGLLDRADTAHSVQLIGLSERAKAEQFIRERGLSGEASIVTSSLNGRPFYLVLYGAFDTRAQAEAAMNTLPSSLSDTHPWVRSVGSLRRAAR